MSRKALYFTALSVLLLAAGCGQVPTAAPGQGLPGTPAPTTTPAAYPPPPTVPTLPPPTPEPAVTPEPTPDLAPKLVVRAVPEELRAEERIAFLKDGDLWLVRPDGGGLVQVTTSRNATALYGWDPSCTRILLGVGEGAASQGTDMPAGRDLWLLEADGSGSMPLVQGLEVLSALWSPVSNQIAYGTRAGDIYLLQVENVDAHIVLNGRTAFLGAWSPDGSKIALRMLAPSDSWFQRLAILAIADGSISFPFPDEANVIDYEPFIWSKDGTQILLQSNRNPDNLWVRVNLSGNAATPLLNGVERFVVVATGISRSPADDQVAFGYYESVNDVPMVWVMNWDGSSLHELTAGANPSWSPDGRRLAYAGPQGGLWVATVDGSGVIEIAKQGADPAWYQPSWCR